MLTKKIKEINDFHSDYFILEKRIFREISKLQKKARTDFKKMLRKVNRKAKVKFSSLHEDAFSKEWQAIIEVSLQNDALSTEQFQDFCLKASEMIGLEFKVLN